jgi:GH15 family glucan-1,4-alpha-glucosidase
VVAAPTTSLPEKLGGVRNWDYRYCWLRDASLTLQALLDLGYTEEGDAYLSWLLHTTRITWPELRIMYDVYGSPDIPERQLDHLRGFAGSRPVRIGNAAAGQLQLDVYGEMLDAVYEYTRRGGRLDRAMARLVGGLAASVFRYWREPDEGIWEIRGGRQHHTYSKAMCWVALDRLVKLHDGGHVQIDRERLVRTQEEIRAEIERRGFSERLGSYVAVFDRDYMDASLLLLARYGYADARSPRMRSTIEAVRESLARNGLLFRYLDENDGLPPGEGAFAPCGFWEVDALALSGEVTRARASFERLLTHANDVGLYAEEIDPYTGAHLGNFPQAFTHVALIDSALTLAQVTS